MGDGNVDNINNSDNPRIRCNSINKDYLEYLDRKIFPILGVGVSLSKEASESAENVRKRNFTSTVNCSNYNDIYNWKTRNHPELKQFSIWYDSGKKKWPKNINFTPTVLKHWYCGDGTFDNYDGSYRISFALSNERKNKVKVEKYFKDIGISKFDWQEHKLNNHILCQLRFTVEQSKFLWRYMSDPLPGFEYKWPEEFK